MTPFFTRASPVFPSAASIATYYIAWISRYFSCWTPGTGYQLSKVELNPHLPTVSVCSIIALRLLSERLVRTRSGSTLQVKLEVNVLTIVNDGKTEIKQHSNEENRQKTQATWCSYQTRRRPPVELDHFTLLPYPRRRLTHYTLKSVRILSLLLSIHVWRIWQGEFVQQSRASLVEDHFLYSCDLQG